MGDFFDQGLARAGSFYLVTFTSQQHLLAAFPRQIKARIAERRSVRRPRSYVYIEGGSGDADGETVFDVESLHVRMGFEDDTADRVLAFSVCTVAIPKASVTNAPKAGKRLWVQIGVDSVNRVNVFQGQIEDARESADGRSYEVVAFDDIRRLQDYPFKEPVTFSDVDGAYVDDYDETTLEASVQIQVAELLSAADVLTHSLTGIEQYPIMPSSRSTVYEELTTLLRASSCRGYLSPSGRLLVTYTDEQPLWAVAMMSDMGNNFYRAGYISPGTKTRLHLPLVQVRAVYPDRVIVNIEDFSAFVPPPQYSAYPAQYVTDLGVPWVLPMFEFTEHNVSGVERIEDSEILNEVRAQFTSPPSLYSYVALGGLKWENIEGITYAALGNAAVSAALDGTSVAEYGTRSRTYDAQVFAEDARATKTPTGPPATTQPSVNYGRYAMYRGDFAESQMRARRFPVQRVRITAPGILSLMPFEIVNVNLPREGVQGYFQVEARRLEMGSGGFRSIDTLKRMDLPEQLVTLDARDESG